MEKWGKQLERVEDVHMTEGNKERRKLQRIIFVSRFTLDCVDPNMFVTIAITLYVLV